MQPIILLGIAVAAVGLVSTGFLAQPWNQFDLWVQSLGWGENMVMSPVSHASVDLQIKKIPNNANTPTIPGDDFFDNVIQSCSFHSADDVKGAPPNAGPLLNPGAIICKLLDENKHAFAEGRLDIPNGYTHSTHIFVPIVQCIDPIRGVINEPNCLDVQAPIHHIKVVVEEPIYEMR